MASSQNAVPAAMQPEVKELLALEVTLNKELNDLLANIKKLRDARDKALSDPKSKLNEQLDAMEKKINEALDKKNAMYEEMSALRNTTGRKANAGDEQASIVENLSILRLRRIPLRDRKDTLEEELRKATNKATDEKMKADRIRIKLPPVEGGTKGEVVTMTDLEKAIKKLDQQLAKAEKNPQQISVLEHLKNQKKQYERSIPSLEEYWRLIEIIFDAKAKEQILRKELDQVEKELKEVDAEIDSLTANLPPKAADDTQDKGEKSAVAEKTEKIWADVQLMTKEIDRLREEKKKIRDSYKANDGSKQSLVDELREASAQRDAIFDKLKEVRAQIPNKNVSYNKAYHSDLIGVRGATVQGLQEEFGVILNVNLEKGEINIKGGKDDIAACEQALTELFKNAEDSRCSATMKYDVGVSRELIGPGGSNIQKMQEASGARINVDSQAGNITVTGPQAAVDLAKQILEEFFAATTRATLKFKPDIGDVVVGRGGKTVRRVQDESGVKSINIKKEAGTIEIIGPKDAVKVAKEMYEDLIKSFQSGGLEMKLAPEMVGAIVGKGGANIMKIQDDTGCIITVNRAPSAGGRGAKGGNATVTIKGPSAGVKAARTMIEEMLFSTREAEKVPFDPSLRLFLIRPPKDDPNGLCPLEKVRKESGCTRVEALRGENFVQVTGKKECTTIAVQMLEELLQANSREVVKIEYPPVLFGVIGIREEGRDSVMDSVRKEFGCSSVSADKSGAITIVGETAAVAGAADKVKEMVNGMLVDIESVPLPVERAIPIIIGSGGQNINRLRRETNTEINLDRNSMTVTIYGPKDGRAKVMESLQKIFTDLQSRE